MDICRARRHSGCLRRERGMTVSEWVRETLREARRRSLGSVDADRKLAADPGGGPAQPTPPPTSTGWWPRSPSATARSTSDPRSTPTSPCTSWAAAHPHKVDARRLLERLITDNRRLVIDVEVLQEILHRYVAIDRRDAIQPCFDVILEVADEVHPDHRQETMSVAREIVLGNHPT
jgi:hypothetical protein